MTRGKNQRKRSHSPQNAEQSHAPAPVRQEEESGELSIDEDTNDGVDRTAKKADQGWYLRFRERLRREPPTAKAVAFFTFVLTLASIIQGWITGGQLKEMKLDRRVIDAQFQTDQRPYLVMAPPTFDKGGFAPDQKLWAVGKITNIGKTPARKMWTGIVLLPFFPPRGTQNDQFMANQVFLNEVFEKLDDSERTLRKNTANIAPFETDIAPQGYYFVNNPQPITLTDAQYNDVRSESDGVGTSGAALIFIGLITYWDGSGNHYRTESCFYHAGNSPEQWQLCKSRNVIQ